jgi:hypothetical protein
VLIKDFVFHGRLYLKLGESADGGTGVRQLDAIRGKIWGTMTMTLESWSIEDVVLCGLNWCNFLPSKSINN